MSSDNRYADLLAELNSAKFQALRPAQERVLGEYQGKYQGDADVAVELPTGAGKMLIAENRSRNGHKVAILSANKTSARQMLQESRELGIPSALMEGPGFAIPSSVKRLRSKSPSIVRLLEQNQGYWNKLPFWSKARLAGEG